MPKPPAPPRPRPRPTPSTPGVLLKAAAEPLAEVERALSILEGRHPEAVRADRETQAALAAKRAQTEALAERARREARWTKLARLGVGAVVFAAALVAGNYLKRRLAEGSAVRDALAPIARPYLALGFAPVSFPRFFAQGRIELVVDKESCAIALGSDREGVVVERASGALEADGPVAWCTCGDGERVTVRLRNATRGGGLLVLQVGAREVGGDYGLRFLVPQPRVLAPPDECSGVSLDAWLSDGRAPVTPTDQGLGPELREGLTRCGFNPVASTSRSLPFAAVPVDADACVLVTSTVVDDALSLRLPGGERPLVARRGAIGFCQRRPANVTVWREGRGDVFAERVAAARVGGIHGLREAAARLGVGPLETWVPPEDLAWYATSTLRASGVSPPEIVASNDGATVANSHLLAFSIAGAMVRAEAPSGDAYLCEPPLTMGSKDAVCVQGPALVWHAASAAGRVGVAEAALPFWMQAFATTRRGGALPFELGLLKLGRRLMGEGFEPTVQDGVTELGDGAVVTGRAGDDAILAIQLAGEPPWVSPCSSNGAAWTLDGEPAFTPLAPGAQIRLACTSSAGGGPARSTRRTVVFRHPTRAK